jgi:hypothetical protein
MLEMVATKWIGRKPLLVVRSLMTGIPAKIAADLDLQYCDDDDALRDAVPDILRDPDPALRKS